MFQVRSVKLDGMKTDRNPSFLEWLAELNREAVRRGCSQGVPSCEALYNLDYWGEFFKQACHQHKLLTLYFRSL